jgi:hypothetical protein
VTTSSNLDIFESTPSFISEKKTSSAHFTSLVFDATPTQTNIDVNFCDCVDTSSEEFCLGKLLEGTCSSYLNECSFSCKACPFQTYETCPPQFDQIVEEEKSYTCVDVFDDYTFSNCDALMFLNPTEFSCPMLEEVFGLDCSGCNCLAADACADISEECETIEPTTCSDIFCRRVLMLDCATTPVVSVMMQRLGLRQQLMCCQQLSQNSSSRLHKLLPLLRQLCIPRITKTHL